MSETTELYIRLLVNDVQEYSQESDALVNSALTLETARQLSKELDARLKLSEENIRSLLNDNHSTYEAALKSAQSTEAATVKLLQGIDELESGFSIDNDINERTNIHTQLVDVAENENQISEKLKNNETMLGCLRLLSEATKHISSMDSLVRDNRLLESATSVIEIEGNIRSLETIDGTRIQKALQERLDLAKLNIKERVGATIRNLVNLDVNNTEAKITIVQDGNTPPKETVKDCYGALNKLDAKDELQEIFCSYFTKLFVRPLLLHSSFSIVHEKTTNNILSIALDNNTEPMSPADVCMVLEASINFINTALSDKHASMDDQDNGLDNGTLGIWGEVYGLEVCDIIVERCILNSVPTTRSELNEFKKEKDSLLAFEDKLKAIGLLESNGISNKPITKAIEGLEDLFIRKRCDSVLKETRDLVEKTDFGIYPMSEHEIWCESLVETLANDPNYCVLDKLLSICKSIELEKSKEIVNVFPKCTISKSIRGLVSAAYKLVNEASQSTQSESMTLLCVTALDMFDLYCALFPAIHKTELSRIPSLAWQAFSDFLYMSHHVKYLGKVVNKLCSSCLTDNHRLSLEVWNKKAALYIKIANTHISDLIERESNELELIVSSNENGFYDAADHAQRTRLEKLIKQLRLALTQLTKAMYPPEVTPQIFYITLGKYIDVVFSAVIDAITDIRDISVDDSQILSNICHEVYTLISLFELPPRITQSYNELLSAIDAYTATSTTAHNDSLLCSDNEEEIQANASADEKRPTHAPSKAAINLAHRYTKQAIKLSQLADIMLISRADILARRQAGLLVQFSVDELVGLIRALFSDTNERARDIEVIKELGDTL